MAKPKKNEPIQAKFHVAKSNKDPFVVPDGSAQDELKAWKGIEGLLTPPMPPEPLREIYRKSPELPKNVRARAQNVAGFGWTVEPVLNFDSPDIDEQVRELLHLEKIAVWRKESILAMAAGKTGKDLPDPPAEPTPAEVESTRAGWYKRARLERSMLTIWLRALCYEMPLEELIKRTEINRGALSYGGWEIIRDKTGAPVRAKLIEAPYLRATALDDKPLAVPHLRETSDVTFESIQVERRFRRFVVRQGEDVTYFKQFGDPRIVSGDTGKFYADAGEFNRAKAKSTERKTAKPATEIIMWSEYSPGAEPYGMPVWHGQSLDVESARLSREFTFDELAHGMIPRGVFAIIDSMIDSPVVQAFQSFLSESGPGSRNRAAIIEMATSSMTSIAGAGRALFEFIDLSGAQKDEATHQLLKADVDSGVSEAFGNPPAMLGRTKDVQNRATAQVTQQIAEEQTYKAIRNLWDFWINQLLVRPMGYRFQRFKLLGPKSADLEALAAILKVAIEQHILTPAEGRVLLADALGKAGKMDDPGRWQMVPPKALLQSMMDQILPPESTDGDGDAPDKADAKTQSKDEGAHARDLLESLNRFNDGEAAEMRKRLGAARAADESSD